MIFSSDYYDLASLTLDCYDFCHPLVQSDNIFHLYPQTRLTPSLLVTSRS